VKSLRPIWFAVLLAFAGPMLLTTAAFAASREVVQDIATLIENNYFDAAKANEVARDLRSAAKAGTFDEFREPRDLAVALTARLKLVDQHFNVVWFSGSSVSRELSVLDSEGRSPAFRSQSYGIRSVARLPGGIGYIELRNFAYFSFAKPDDPARLAVDAALQLVADASAVIIDLRDNIGGYAAMASYLVSAFTPPDADIFDVVHRRDGIESERPKQHYRNPKTEVPVYVLVNASTASAAEAAAYTLQAAQRAVIVGERTSGAANPGGMFPVREGFNLFISIGTPINPLTGKNWEGRGVQPDVAVSSDEALQRAQRLALEKLRNGAHGSASVEIEWTLEALRAETNPPARAALGDYAGTYGEAVIAIVDDEVTLRRGRRAVQALRPLRPDLFFVAGEPSQRIAFERDARGKVTGFQLLRSSAYSTWFPRR
jgi:hypothetical protein